MGIECFRVQFPKGMDANEYARTTQPAAKALGIMLTSAAWLGQGKRPSVGVIQPRVIEEEKAAKKKISEEEPHAHVKKDIPSPDDKKPAAKEKSISPLRAEQIFPLAANPESVQQEEPPQRTMPLAAPAEAQVKIEQGEITITIGARTYRVLGLEKCTTRGKMHVNVKVSGRNVRDEYRYHGDTLDMESAQRRASFTKQAAHELAVKEETIHEEVGKLWSTLEELQREQIKKTLQGDEAEAPAMTAEEQAQAMKLLGDPRLLDRVLSDFDRCGVVGEETNKRIAYLAAVSRLLKKPLAVVVQSPSAAGKSSLMESVLAFVPEEHREEYSAMTSQALFYMGQKNLQHKIVAVSEVEGAQKAAYPLKLLQSEGKLNIASTGKDPVTGKHVTHEYQVEGPVMIFLTTTAQDVDEELLNRCFVLTVNEDREQTRAIHEKQRQAETLEGMWADDERQQIIRLHRNAQRLLRPLRVVNEHVKQHTFPDHMTRTRRDHTKFLTLVQAIALLHQHQREIKRDTRKGKTLEYIEATAEDVALARQLINEVLTPSLDELLPQTRRLLLLIDQMVKQECERLGIERSEYRFMRATVRHYSHLGDTQLRANLKRLEEMEYLIVRHGGPGARFVYQLHFEMDAEGKPVLAGLSELYENCAGVNGNCAGGWRPGSGGIAGGARGQTSPVMTRENRQNGRNLENNSIRETGAGPGSSLIVTASRPNGASKANGHAHAKRAEVK